ncbi:MAG: DUF3857 domain-containing protein [Muribaculaceae bacterium]|nr:DUF3857 domain-containing protein [Muribaculaceae bacterium]
MKKILLIFALMALALTASAQSLDKPNLKWGNPTQEEMSMTSYSPDPEAEAVVLCKTTSQRYDIVAGDFKLYYQVKCRIKILKNEGKDQANIAIPYYYNGNKLGSREEIESFKGTSFNLVNGKVVKDKVSKDMITHEDISKTRRVMKVTFPKVEAGTVIEYEYTINSDFYFNVRDWVVQSSIPVAYTSYEITVPEWFRQSLNMTGRYNLDVNKKTVNMTFHEGTRSITCNGERYEFQGKNLPALKKEPFVFNPLVYGQKVAVEIVGVAIPGVAYKSFAINWDDIDKQLLNDDDFGDVMKKNPLKKEMQEAGIYDMTDRAEKINAIIKLLRSRVKWNEKFSLSGSSPSKALKEGSASNTTLNLMLTAMLNDAGIEAHPAVLCTRDEGPFTPTRPSMETLSTTVVVIPNGQNFDCVDCSIEHSGINVLNPLMVVNNARIVHPKIHDWWIDLTTKSIASSRSVITASIDENGLVTATRKSVYLDAEADDLRDDYRDAKDEAEFLQERFKNDNIEIQDYSIENVDDFTKPVNETISFTQQQTCTGDHIYVNQLIFPLISESPFKSETRILPIELPYQENHNISIVFTIPDGWEVEEIPQPIAEVTENNGLALKVLSQANEKNITVSCRLNNNRLLYAPEEYVGVKMFFDDMQKHSKDMIVLRKKQ